MGKLEAGTAAVYVAAQLTGAVLGTLPLLAWGAMGRTADFGATIPSAGYSTAEAFWGEVVTTFAMISLLASSSRPAPQALHPGDLPPLYSLMVFLEAPVSGTSTNPARSSARRRLGPVGRLVDLLGRPAPRHVRRGARL